MVDGNYLVMREQGGGKEIDGGHIYLEHPNSTNKPFSPII